MLKLIKNIQCFKSYQFKFHNGFISRKLKINTISIYRITYAMQIRTLLLSWVKRVMKNKKNAGNFETICNNPFCVLLHWIAVTIPCTGLPFLSVICGHLGVGSSCVQSV